MDTPFIYIPSSPPRWCTPDKCVWTGPPFLREISPLHDSYGSIPDLKRFFVVLLDITAEATLQHVNQDLTLLRSAHPESLPREMVPVMESYYTTLSKMLVSETPMKKTR